MATDQTKPLTSDEITTYRDIPAANSSPIPDRAFQLRTLATIDALTERAVLADGMSAEIGRLQAKLDAAREIVKTARKSSWDRALKSLGDLAAVLE